MKKTAPAINSLFQLELFTMAAIKSDINLLGRGINRYRSIRMYFIPSPQPSPGGRGGYDANTVATIKSVRCSGKSRYRIQEARYTATHFFYLAPCICCLDIECYIGITGKLKEGRGTAKLNAIDKFRWIHVKQIHGHLTGDHSDFRFNT